MTIAKERAKSLRSGRVACDIIMRLVSARQLFETSQPKIGPLNGRMSVPTYVGACTW
jgi:hypothetical protein